MISANIVTQQELRAELGLLSEEYMRMLLVGALIVNLVGCSHQSPLAQTAADSCASRNPLACWMSVPVSIEPTSLTTNSNVGGKSRHSSLMVAR